MSDKALLVRREKEVAATAAEAHISGNLRLKIVGYSRIKDFQSRV